MRDDLSAGFTDLLNSRLYRTGDFARWNDAGSIDYLGRRDDQVKVRGIRIELGEIETLLGTHPMVAQAAVVAHGAAGAKRLSAYVNTTDEAQGSGDVVGRLREYLRAHLPAALVPTTLKVMDVLPLTSSGKLDRRSLPQSAHDEAQRQHKPARTQTETLLARLWSDVLGLSTVGVDDDFFALGGHSLIAMRLISRIRDAFSVDLPLEVLFEAPTIEALALRLDALGGAEVLPPIAAQTDAPWQLSFAQARLWFLEQLEGPSATYSMPATLSLTGPLDHGALRSAARALYSASELVLFSRRTANRKSFYRPIRPDHHFRLVRLRAKRLSMSDAMCKAHATAAEPAASRCSTSSAADDQHWLAFSVHHIISDDGRSTSCANLQNCHAAPRGASATRQSASGLSLPRGKALHADEHLELKHIGWTNCATRQPSSSCWRITTRRSGRSRRVGRLR